MKYEEQPEQIQRVATMFGNGAHICVPKGWVGEQIVVVRPQRKSLKERILSVLEPHLDAIIGAYFYGSYARAEQTEDSDIDLFVITSKKIKIRAQGFEIVCLQQSEMEKALTIEPALMYAILTEAKPIVNAQLLEELKLKNHPRKSDFKEFFKDCRRIIKIQEETLAYEKGTCLSSDAVIYSLVLRLRGIFIVRSLLKGESYSHKRFKAWIKSNLLHVDFNSIWEAYRASKQERKIKQQIPVRDIKLLVGLLKKEITRLQHG